MDDKSFNVEAIVQQQLRALSTAVGEAGYEAAVTAYENARMDGLCHEGAWECAVHTLRGVELEKALGGEN